MREKRAALEDLIDHSRVNVERGSLLVLGCFGENWRRRENSEIKSRPEILQKKQPW